MKLKFYTLFILVGFAFLANSVLAQSNASMAIIKGYVKNTNGVALANVPVLIQADSVNATSPACFAPRTKLTNANGFYQDTLSCLGAVINVVRVSTPNCTGAPLVQIKQVPTSRIVEANFTVCIPNSTPTCNAYFSAQVNGKTASFMGGNVTTVVDTTTIYTWTFGDGTSKTGKDKQVTHTYGANGTYSVCLAVSTANNCRDTFCAAVTIRDTIIPTPIQCQAYFEANNATPLQVKFNSSQSARSVGDSIVSRIWNFGDSSAALTGNRVDPTKVYTKAGTYNVCLKITTAKGCTSTLCKLVVVKDSVVQTPAFCKANFVYTQQSTTIKFNSISSFAASNAGALDSIISRTWNFGDSSATAILSGNVVDPIRQYARPGVYNVCLTIRTVRGCVSTFCQQVIATNVVSACVPQYFVQRTSGSRTVQFNSAASWVPANDTIKARRWTFGDGTTLLGNVIDPIKTYTQKGIYTVCLTINTAKGCTNTYCNVVNIQDTLPNAPTTANGVKIVSLSPVPARTTLNATIWSVADNVRADIGIYDVYGVKKFGIIRNLLKGNNVYNLSVSSLLNGPYFLRVNTTLGNDSKPFYKL